MGGTAAGQQHLNFSRPLKSACVENKNYITKYCVSTQHHSLENLNKGKGLKPYSAGQPAMYPFLWEYHYQHS